MNVTHFRSIIIGNMPVYYQIRRLRRFVSHISVPLAAAGITYGTIMTISVKARALKKKYRIRRQGSCISRCFNNSVIKLISRPCSLRFYQCFVLETEHEHTRVIPIAFKHGFHTFAKQYLRLFTVFFMPCHRML